MPVRFLTDADREQLSQFPQEVPLEDLHTYFALSPTDLALVQTQRGDHQQLGFAIQLGTLRYLGFCPDDLTAAPAALVQYVAQQLGVDPAALQAYGSRAHTRTDHLLKIQGHLGYRTPTEEDLQGLADWLVERALEHDKPTLLLHLAAEKLQRDKLVRPGITRLERLVATVRERAQEETYHLLTPLLTPERRTLLDGLLVRDSTLGRTRLDWLRQEATANAPRAILAAIEKLTFLREHAVDTWDLGVLNPNRRTFLARLGTKATNQILARAIPERRYPILVAFLAQALQDRTDEALDLFSQYLAGAYRTAERHLEAFRQSTAKATNAHLWLFQRIAGIVLDPMVADAAVRGTIFQQVPEAELRAAVESNAALVRPPDDRYFDFLAQSYPTIRSFAPALLRAFTFQGNVAAGPLLDAIVLLRTVNAENRRKIPQHAPLGFVSDR